MGIYIKNMAMPKNCASCPISVLSDNRLFCERTSNVVFRIERDRDCPLIELPPHGRLIDADAISEDDRQVYGFYNSYDLQQLLDSAPTIIEAENQP